MEGGHLTRLERLESGFTSRYVYNTFVPIESIFLITWCLNVSHTLNRIDIEVQVGKERSGIHGEALPKTRGSRVLVESQG